MRETKENRFAKPGIFERLSDFGTQGQEENGGDDLVFTDSLPALTIDHRHFRSMRRSSGLAMGTMRRGQLV